jgi:precorrin-2 dehydrogenase/sirohydrochlorin ferrochelatase
MREVPMKRPFPMVSLLVAERTCLLIGGQEAALSRAEELLAAGAKLRIVARRASEAMLSFAAQHQIDVAVREMTLDDLEGAFIVINTSRDEVLAQKIFDATRGRHCILATLDDPSRSDIGFTAVVRAGLLRVGVSTGGASPALAKKLREELERLLVNPKTERLLRWMEKKREEWHAREKSFAVRSQELRNLLEGFSIKGVLEYPTKFLEEDERQPEEKT